MTAPPPGKEDLTVRIAVAIEKLVEVFEAYLPAILASSESIDAKLEKLVRQSGEDR